MQWVLKREYDTGRAGDTYSRLGWLFVPRFIAPSKPIMDQGQQVTLLVYGHDQSSTGPTFLGEAYWNGGWLYLVLSAFTFGVILWLISIANLHMARSINLANASLIIYGAMFGILVRNFFTSGVVGSFVIYFILALALLLFSSLNTTKQKV